MKKYISIFLLILLIFIDIMASGLGDIDGNGKIGVTDYILVRKYILKTNSLTNEQRKLADLNQDGNITSIDYVLLRKKIVSGDTTSVQTQVGKKYTAKFIIQDKNAVNASLGEVSCTTGAGTTCEITVPTLTANPNSTVIGWNTDSNATTASVSSGGKITLTSDITYYSISSTVVTITYSVGEDIPGVNMKAQSLSFYSNEHTKCTSYNGKGCNIKWIPTIIAPGNVVHGFSKTPSGNLINVAKTVFTESTTLYARIYDGGEGNIRSMAISHYEVIGNVLVETQSDVPDTVALQFIDFIKKIYKDFPHQLMWNGTISFVTRGTELDFFGTDSNYTVHGSPYSVDFSHIYVFYTPPGMYEDDHYYFGSCMHEIIHAYNYGIYWNGGLATPISKTEDIVNLYNKYKNAKPRPNSDYAYTNTSEFYSELIHEYFRQHREIQYNDRPYKSTSNGWAQDLTAAAEKYNAIGYSYYQSIGRL